MKEFQAYNVPAPYPPYPTPVSASVHQRPKVPSIRPPPWQNQFYSPDLASVTFPFLLFCISHLWEKILCLSLSFWLISLSVIPCSFIQVMAICMISSSHYQVVFHSLFYLFAYLGDTPCGSQGLLVGSVLRDHSGVPRIKASYINQSFPVLWALTKGPFRDFCLLCLFSFNQKATSCGYLVKLQIFRFQDLRTRSWGDQIWDHSSPSPLCTIEGKIWPPSNAHNVWTLSCRWVEANGPAIAFQSSGCEICNHNPLSASPQCGCNWNQFTWIKFLS